LWQSLTCTHAHTSAFLSVVLRVLTCTCMHNAHAHTHSHTDICTMAHSIRLHSPKTHLVLALSTDIVTATWLQVLLTSRSCGWRDRKLDLGRFHWCWVVLVLFCGLCLSHFIAALLFASFPYYLLWKLSCHRWPFRMRSASLANVPLLTVFIFWSVKACHWHVLSC
jgi:hypothetical protein